MTRDASGRFISPTKRIIKGQDALREEGLEAIALKIYLTEAKARGEATTAEPPSRAMLEPVIKRLREKDGITISDSPDS